MDDQLIYTSRKKFHDYMVQSLYQEGINTFTDLLEKEITKQSCEKDSRLLDEWWMQIQRYRYVICEVSDIEQALREYESESAEYCYVESLVEYHYSRYGNSLLKLQAALLKLQEQPEDLQTDDYLRFIVYTNMAKCHWRLDDFPRSRYASVLAMRYFQQYDQLIKQNAQVKYDDYYYGRILSVHPRLITQRNGMRYLPAKEKMNSKGILYRQTTSDGQLKKTIDLLKLVEGYFKKNALLSFDNQKGGHLFQIEIYELYINAYRLALEARSDKPGVLTPDEEKERQRKVVEYEGIVNDYLEKIKTILSSHVEKGHFKKDINRRIAHVPKIVGTFWQRKVITKGRQNTWQFDRNLLLDKSLVGFNEELEIRNELFGCVPNATRACCFNNLSLTYNLFGHGRMKKKRGEEYGREIKDDLEPALDFNEAIKQANFALEANGVDPNTSIEGFKVKCDQVLSFPEFYASMDNQMEARMRLYQERNKTKSGKIDVDTFNKLYHYYALTTIAEEENFRRLGSILARQDVGRRTHPIYELMLEACYDRQRHKLTKEEEEELNGLIIRVMRRAIALHTYRRLDDAPPIGLAENNRARKIISDGEKWLPGNEPILSQESLANFNKLLGIERGHEEKVLYFDEFTKIDYANSLHLIDDTEGGVVIHFVGRRHHFFFCFAGLGDNLNKCSPRLVKVGSKAAYSRSNDIRNTVRYLNYLADERLEIEFEWTQLSSEKKQIVRKEWPRQLQCEKLDQKFQEQLEKMVELLYKELPDEIKNLKRLYLISDDFGATFPTAALPLFPDKDKVWFEEAIVGGHNSVQFWSGIRADLLNHNKPSLSEVLITVIGSSTDVASSDQLYKGVDEIKEIIYPRSEYKSVGERKRHIKNHFSTFNCIDSQSKKRDFLARIKKSSILIFFGHTEIDSDTREPAFLLHSKDGDGGNSLVLTRDDIEAIENLENVVLCVFLTCQGGQGTSSTGNPPESLATSLSRVGVKNITFTSKILWDVGARIYLEKLFAELNEEATVGEAHQASQKELRKKYLEDPLTNFGGHPSQVGYLRNSGDHNFRFVKQGHR